MIFEVVFALLLTLHLVTAYTIDLSCSKIRKHAPTFADKASALLSAFDESGYEGEGTLSPEACQQILPALNAANSYICEADGIVSWAWTCDDIPSNYDVFMSASHTLVSTAPSIAASGGNIDPDDCAAENQAINGLYNQPK